MEVFETKSALRAGLSSLRGGARLGLVTTMGSLHRGHLALVRAACAECDRVVVSIFVNPTQFGEAADLDAYPKDTDRDLALLRAEGVDAVFVPSVEEMYAADSRTIVETTGLADILIGALRPGHFRGVATVVAKLFNLVRPDRAYFGEKDYQQLLVIRTMVRDLDFGLEILGVPTEREADGLAMSSRNVRLSPAERQAAPVLAAALDRAETLLAAAPDTPVETLEAEVRAVLAAEPLAATESVDIRHAETLDALAGRLATPAVILLAVRFGDVLLIDQRVVSPA